MNSNTIKILTGKKQTGKTTSLVNFCNQQQNTTGILTPIINGKRFFYDIATKTFFAMEFNNQIGDEIIAVGKYNFSAKAFAKANTILQTIQHNPNQLVIIDELGPLELNNKGFANTIKQLLQFNNINLLFVVRDELINKIIDFFNIKNVLIITTLK